ncbi:hypothetical protein F4810DRAFT_714265 [Camillea tinctor]|nr:hypothetical protein F4810DRAFT_714265 [Camillea tinctor]
MSYWSPTMTIPFGSSTQLNDANICCTCLTNEEHQQRIAARRQYRNERRPYPFTSGNSSHTIDSTSYNGGGRATPNTKEHYLSTTARTQGAGRGSPRTLDRMDYKTFQWLTADPLVRPLDDWMRDVDPPPEIPVKIPTTTMEELEAALEKLEMTAQDPEVAMKEQKKTFRNHHPPHHRSLDTYISPTPRAKLPPPLPLILNHHHRKRGRQRQQRRRE